MLAIVVGALLVPAAAKAVPPTLDSAGQTTYHLTASWTLQAGTEIHFIEASKTQDVASDGSFADPAFIDVPTTVPPYTSVDQLAPGSYYVHVAAVPTGCAPTCVDEFSNIRQVEIPFPAPPVLTSVGQSERRLTASWTLPTNIKSFYIEVATSPDTYPEGAFLAENTVFLDDTIDFNQTSYLSFIQLRPGTYYVHVAGFDLTACPTGSEPSCIAVFSEILPLTIPSDAIPTPPAAPPASPPASPPADKVTSFAALKCASTQKVGSLVVQASMPENGTITVGGSVNVPNAAKVFKLKAVSVNATAGKTVKITVKLPAKALKAVKKALKRHKKVKANLTITARDGAGNTKSEKRAVKLKG